MTRKIKAMKKPGLLLHVCCAPCSTHVIDLLRREHEVEAFYYNPNIHPAGEYEKRLAESKRYCRKIGAAFHLGEHDPEAWLRRVKGHEGDEEGGERCRICYRMRLEETARKARKMGFKFFATTLSISPHKDAKTINELGAEIGEKHGLRFYGADFKKKDGFKRSVELSREHGMRRQSYCGCVFSMR